MKNCPNHNTILDTLELGKALSEDVETQTSAVLVFTDGNMIVEANRLTPGVAATEERTTRPQKYPWIEHAERRVIYRAAKAGRATEGATLYMRWFPCADCARAIALSGISTLVCDPVPENDGRYDFSVSREILMAKGIDLKQI